jgi:hypothetical protein
MSELEEQRAKHNLERMNLWSKVLNCILTRGARLSHASYIADKALELFDKRFPATRLFETNVSVATNKEIDGGVYNFDEETVSDDDVVPMDESKTSISKSQCGACLYQEECRFSSENTNNSCKYFIQK